MLCHSAAPVCYVSGSMLVCWRDGGLACRVCLVGAHLLCNKDVRPLAPKLGPQPSAASKRRREYADQDPGKDHLELLAACCAA